MSLLTALAALSSAAESSHGRSGDEAPLNAAFLQGDDDDGVPTNSSDIDCIVMCPTLEAYPKMWPLWLIVICYTVLLAATVRLMYIACRVSLKGIRFSSMFLSLQAICCIMRIIFFTVEFHWKQQSILVLLMYGVPIYVQCVTVFLLIIFMLRTYLIMQQRQNQIKYLYCASFLLLGVLFAACVAVPLLKDDSDSDGSGGSFDEPLTIFSITAFGAVTLVTAVSAFLSYRMIMQVILDKHMRHKYVMVFRLLVVYVLIFAGRFIYAVTYALGANEVQKTLSRFTEEERWRDIYLVYLGFYLVFECVPLALLTRVLHLWFYRPTVAEDVFPSVNDGGTYQPMQSETTGLLGSSASSPWSRRKKMRA